MSWATSELRPLSTYEDHLGIYELGNLRFKTIVYL